MTYPRSTCEALVVIDGALDAVDHASRSRLEHRDRLDLLTAARRVGRRLEALVGLLTAEADRAGASERVTGTPLTSWLTLSGQVSAKEAAGLVFTGRELASHGQVAEAALEGGIGLAQARAIHKVLTELPAALTEAQRERAEGFLLEKAATTSAADLGRLTRTVIDQVTPDHSPTAEQEQRRLDEQSRRALSRRSLTFHSDNDGSVLIRGSLPAVAATGLIKLVDAYAESDRRRARDALDVRAESRRPDQRRADGLLALIAAHQRTKAAPALAGDRPRVVLIMRETDLRDRAEQAGLLDTGTPIAAGDLRRLCCDADLVPAVLGGPSEVLDVGRTQRLVTPPIRRALALRDAGCVFPGCDVPDSACDAHHIVPWWNHGTTALANLVSLCSHHHQLVEPPRFHSGAPPDRWEVRLHADGTPEVIPPRRADPERRPIRHDRALARGRCA